MRFFLRQKAAVSFLAATALALTMALAPTAAWSEEAAQPQPTESETPTSELPEQEVPEDAASTEEGDPSSEGIAEAADPTEDATQATNTEDAPESSVPVEAEDVATAPTLTASAHVQNLGWKSASRSGEGWVLGTTGRSLRLEGVMLSVNGGSVSYKTHVQSYGWQAWVANGNQAGTTGQSKRLEAIRIKLEGALANEWSIQYRCHVQSFGWLGWAADGAIAGSTGSSKRLEALEIRIVPKGTKLPSGGGAAWRDAGLSAQAHVQSVGWQGALGGYNVTMGTTGRSLRVEAFKIWRPGGIDMGGDITYRAHVQSVGWQAWKKNGAMAGSTGKGRRVEALQVNLTGELAANYDVWYRVHAQRLGWMAWTKNSGYAGTEGLSTRIEAIQVALVRKGADHPSSSDQATALPYIKKESISYSAGRAGSGVAMSSFNAVSSDASGLAVSYEVHQTKGGWAARGKNGEKAGSGAIDALRLSLSGEKSRAFTVWYRTYVKGTGWTCWAKNGQDCGSVGRNLPIDGVQVRLESASAGGPSNAGAALGVACVTDDFGQLLAQANAKQRKIVQSAKSTPWPGVGLCAGWVENVYRNAGINDVSGNACDLYDLYCKSSSKRNLKVGMIVAVRTHTRTYAGSIWGHVGIYVGDGWVMHSVTSGVTRMPLQDWINYYGTTYTPKWGWLGNARVA